MARQSNRSLLLRALSCGWLLLSPLFAQTPPPSPHLADEIRHLVGIENRMRTSLEQLPNYTCHMEVRRAHLGSKARQKLAKKIENLQQHDGGAALRSYREGGSEVEVSRMDIPLDAADTVALEVAFIDGEELYAFPGSARFEDRELHSLIGHGTTGTGSFAGHVRNILVNGAAVTKYVGEELLDGQQVLRYDYEVSLLRSGYSVTNEGQTATVPYSGSFWAAVDTDELLQITIGSDAVPTYVGIDQFATHIDYQTLQLDEQPFIVPRRARMTMLLSSGVESLSETEYKDCRSFVGSSTLSFDDPLPQFSTEKLEVIEDVELPIGLNLPLRLTTAIDSATAQVGSPVAAELASKVRYGSKGTMLPKGAVLSGRIRRLEFYEGADEHYVVGIEFRELSFDAGRKRADVHLSLEQVASERGVQHRPSGPVSRSRTSIRLGDLPTETRTTVETYRERGMPGVGLFYVRARQFQLTPGFRMTRKTVAAPTLLEAP